jgi:hypothetical protein
MVTKMRDGADLLTQPFHAVHFYRDPGALCAEVARYVVSGLACDQPSLIIARPERGKRIIATLARAVDVIELLEARLLVVRDADAMMAKFMVDGQPDTVLFESVAAATLESFAEDGKHTVRAYGEMVDVLWQCGMTSAATRLEVLWNDLARRYDFNLLCGYALDCVEAHDLHEISAHHSHIVSPDSDDRLG